MLEAKDKYLNNSALPVIKGKVTTVTGYPIKNLNITFESYPYLYKRKTSLDGTFVTNLPSGYYEIRTDEWLGNISYRDNEIFFSKDCKSYFRPAIRSGIQLNDNDIVTINFVLIESGCVNWSEERQDGSFLLVTDVDSPSRIKYETLYYGKPKSQGTFDLVVQYGERVEKTSIFYKLNVGQQFNLLWEKPYPGVLLTYNATSIYANEVEFNKKWGIVYARKNVVVEDGKNIFTAKEVIIRLGVKPSFKFRNKSLLFEER